MRTRTIFKKATLAAMLLLAGVSFGCNAAKQEPGPMLPVTPPPQSMTPEEIANNPGSLFNEAHANMLFEDNRARRIGDILMVKIEENTKATNKANTKADKTSEYNIQASEFFGQSSLSMLPLPMGGNLPIYKGDTGGYLLKTKTESKFSTTGSTDRGNTVLATVAARVINVLPGGVLQVEGASETRVNDETQYLVVAGLVRARDVQSDNTVLSSQMADAKIAIFGKGTLADKQKPGWLTRVLDILWPF